MRAITEAKAKSQSSSSHAIGDLLLLLGSRRSIDQKSSKRAEATGGQRRSTGLPCLYKLQRCLGLGLAVSEHRYRFSRGLASGDRRLRLYSDLTASPLGSSFFARTYPLQLQLQVAAHRFILNFLLLIVDFLPSHFLYLCKSPQKALLVTDFFLSPIRTIEQVFKFARYMLGCMSAVCVSPGNTRIICSRSSQLLRGYANVTICKSFRSANFGSKVSRRKSPHFADSYCKGGSQALPLTNALYSPGRQLYVGLSTCGGSMTMRLSLPPSEKCSKISWSAKHVPWGFGGASLGFCLSFTTSEPVYAEASKDQNYVNGGESGSHTSSSHGKKIYTNYSVTGIPGDGRCLFRSVAHGACILSGKSIPDENLQRVLADELRSQVADEFVKRRKETEWFIEGDFDTYISRIRIPHVWGGEPELFMASHVLQMPITVYMHDEEAGGLIAIAEYGQEYGKEKPIQVLYHGFGHYDALQIHEGRGLRSRS